MLTLIGRSKPGGGAPISRPAGIGPVAEPSPLLAHLAGEFAPEIARLWPAPHAPFVLAESARRHLACLALARVAESDHRPGPAFVAAALEGSLKRAVAALVPDGPPGLVRALGRLGESAWPAADYRLLLRLMFERSAAKVLRHAAEITVREVRVLGSLPAPLAQGGGVLLKLTEDQSRLVALCHAGVQNRDGADKARSAAERWAAAPTAKALFEAIGRDISVERTEAFHPGTPRLRPLTTRKALDDASRRYRNCLDGRELGPNVSYYEWAGPPGVVIELNADPLWGWVLEEGRLTGNEVVPDDVREAIAADLRTMGVHLGFGRWSLHWSLKRAADRDFRFADEHEQLALAFGR